VTVGAVLGVIGACELGCPSPGARQLPTGAVSSSDVRQRDDSRRTATRTKDGWVRAHWRDPRSSEAPREWWPNTFAKQKWAQDNGDLAVGRRALRATGIPARKSPVSNIREHQRHCFSPLGDRIAFTDHPVYPDDAGNGCGDRQGGPSHGVVGRAIIAPTSPSVARAPLRWPTSPLRSICLRSATTLWPSCLAKRHVGDKCRDPLTLPIAVRIACESRRKTRPK
jgi:hypothetical protein